MGIWYLGTGTAPIMGALVAYGLLFYTGNNFRNWQIVFLIFGLITIRMLCYLYSDSIRFLISTEGLTTNTYSLNDYIVIGICVFFIMPDNPMKAKYLTQTEKKYSIERIRENQTGIENKHFKFSQFIETFKDPQTYFIIIIVTAMDVSNASTSTFSSQIIKGFGFSTKVTELLNLPSGAISVISVFTGTYLAGRFDQRCLSSVLVLTIGLLGGCLLAFSPSHMKGAQLAGNYLTNTIGSALPIMYSIAGANVAGHTKKVYPFFPLFL